MEAAPGLVGVMECGVAVNQHVKVRYHLLFTVAIVLVFPAVVTCPALTNPDNGVVTLPNNNLESTATYTCDNGYTLTGDTTTRTCQANGMWSGSDPTCTRKFNALAIEISLYPHRT